MFFLMMMFALWFAFGPWRRRRYWRHSRHAQLYWMGPGMLYHSHHGGMWVVRGPEIRRAPLMTHEPPPRHTESRFESLKRRYVSGELSDTEYERQIDEILRQPGGMQQI